MSGTSLLIFFFFFKAAACFLCSILCVILAFVGIRKNALINRAIANQSTDIYVRVEDEKGEGSSSWALPGSNEADPFASLKPTRRKCLELIIGLTDDVSGVSIKPRRFGVRQVGPNMVGFRFVDWALREKKASTRPEAVQLGRMLIAKRYLIRADGKTSSSHKNKRGRDLAEFEDDNVFYIFPVAERHELFALLDSDVRDKLLYGFRPVKRGTPMLVLLPVGIFTVPLATSGVALSWLGLDALFPGRSYYIVGFVVAGLALALFLTALVAYLIKCFVHGGAVRDEWNHPMKINLFGMITLTMLNFTAIGSFIDPILTTVLFYISAPLQIGVTLFTAARWVRIARGISDINPSYFIPVVGLAAVPIASVPAGISEFGWLMLGAGTVYWLLMFALIVMRVFFVPNLPRTTLPMLLMAIAPPCLIVNSYLTLSFNIIDVASRMLFGVALFNTVLFTIIRVGTPRVSFMLAHWSYIFPLATFSVACQKYSQAIRGIGGAAGPLSVFLVIVSLIVVCILWLWAAGATVYYLFHENLVAREAKVLSEETAGKVYQGKIASDNNRSPRNTGSVRRTVARPPPSPESYVPPKVPSVDDKEKNEK